MLDLYRKQEADKILYIIVLLLNIGIQLSLLSDDNFEGSILKYLIIASCCFYAMGIASAFCIRICLLKFYSNLILFLSVLQLVSSAQVIFAIFFFASSANDPIYFEVLSLLCCQTAMNFLISDYLFNRIQFITDNQSPHLVNHE